QLTFGTPAPSTTSYKAHTFDQLISHDDAVPPPEGETTFQQRYWFDASFYQPGGPVYLLDGGETDGEGRIPFLEKGILRILSEATGGIGIVFEHRYYGESFPVENLTTDNFRYLTTMQSLQDSAYFAQNVKLPGVQYDVTAPNSPWIYYGGSYAGAKSAFARKLFPDVWWGAIASSAVTKAIVDYWEYHEPIRASGPPECISALINNTNLIDTLLSAGQPLVTSTLKTFFGLPNVTLDEDFVNTLSMPLGSWQARNWDPKVGSTEFFSFCDALTSPSDELAASLNPDEELLLSAFPPFPSDPRKTLASFKAYAAYIQENVASLCPPDEDQNDCFGTDLYEGDGLDDAPWKSWTYQYCTEWGYFQRAAPEGTPSLISQLITLDYTSEICSKAFPPGKLATVPKTPNVTEINQWGGFELEYSRLAFIDGSEDPWIYATPHSPNAANPKRKDTISKPFKVIKGGVHHWDENGLLDGEEPAVIKKVHLEEVGFVMFWLDEWEKKKNGSCCFGSNERI
ncbi:hypothetical protein MNV49_007893, partial [Pseudohyphozyma bogoriensis]